MICILLENDKNFLDDILFEGCNKADAIASKKVKKIHKILGFQDFFD